MGSGTAKAVRLELGVDLRDRIHAQGGNDEDIKLVREEAPEFMDQIAQQFIERARVIQGDKDCFRLVNGEVAIQIPALKRPTLRQLQKEYGWIRTIERDDSTEEPVALCLATVLKPDEPSINGATYECRFTKLRVEGKLLGYQHLQWFVKKQHKSAVKALVGKGYIDFPGLIVVSKGGSRHVPCVSDDGLRFVGGWNWLSRDFHGRGRIAVSRKQFSWVLGP